MTPGIVASSSRLALKGQSAEPLATTSCTFAKATSPMPGTASKDAPEIEPEGRNRGRRRDEQNLREGADSRSESLRKITRYMTRFTIDYCIDYRLLISCVLSQMLIEDSVMTATKRSISLLNGVLLPFSPSSAQLSPSGTEVRRYSQE